MPKHTKTHQITLIAEKGDDALWGRIKYDDDLIVVIGETTGGT
ncbi:hypothetical protein QTN47_00235 [Danxiaibacter flavus]|uniref:Uncharacterized protein n=1 Tax=Danxiaibacter flavus TaxID=3049108 RepID=A0ABV3Z7R7_9BACT|nr:hypothetical protein QNM32_00235 [Chitinophagaceae bacterium DXS]